MFHGISSVPVSVPETLHPTPLSNIESSHGDKTPTSPKKSQTDDNNKGQGNKESKKRKPRKGKETDGDQGQGQEEATLSQAVSGLSVESKAEKEGFRPAWSRISSSESDYSDTEGVQSSRYRSTCAKVRQCALACLHTVIKVSILFR